MASEAAITYGKAVVASSCNEDCEAKLPSACGRVIATGVPRDIPVLMVAKIQALINVARHYIELASEDNDDGTYARSDGP